MARATSYTPTLMTPEVGKALREAGYFLPESWPTNARVAPDMTSADGWQYRVVGSGKEEGAVVYVAPDGSQFVRATHGARPVLVGLSKRTSALPLRVLPGARRPKWVIEDMPKGQIPEHLKKFLLRKGEKLAKGQQRLANEAEKFAVEPEMPPSGKVSDADVARWVREALAHTPGQKPGAMLAQLRKEGRSISGRRFRAAYAQALVKGGK